MEHALLPPYLAHRHNFFPHIKGATTCKTLLYLHKIYTMKKYILPLLSLAFLNTSISAQDDYDSWMQAEGTLQGFEQGANYYTFVSDANLRDKPGTTGSTVIAKLPIGSKVTIMEVSSDSFAQRGIKLPWLKVQCETGAIGYIWGGFMALASIQTPDIEYTPNRGVLYLTGVSAFQEDKHEITVQVRVAEKGKELSRTEFTTQGDLSYYPSFSVQFEPLKNVKAVLAVNYYYPACGYASGDNLVFWQENNTLSRIIETSSVGDGGVFYSSETVLLPSQPGGIGDHLLVVKDESEFEEKGDDLVRSRQSVAIVLYKWTGSKLLKVKELK